MSKNDIFQTYLVRILQRLHRFGPYVFHRLRIWYVMLSIIRIVEINFEVWTKLSIPRPVASFSFE